MGVMSTNLEARKTAMDTKYSYLASSIFGKHRKIIHCDDYELIPHIAKNYPTTLPAAFDSSKSPINIRQENFYDLHMTLLNTCPV